MKHSTAMRRAGAAAALIGAATLGLAAPAGAAPATMFGDPAAAAAYWAPQTLDDCALMSVADVVGQVTGTAPSEEEIIGLAATMPSPNHPGSIYFPPDDADNPNSGNGTDADDLPVLLAHYGIKATMTDDDTAASAGEPTGILALQHDLADGRRVIAFVNSETIWNTDGDRSRPDHALVVTGVDTAKGIVHLNDSGTDDGCDEQVPVATFGDAWRDHVMVVTA
ncbi:hypothetical protein ACN27E_01220 [Mycobacterium sp. WMMD1722]|uniref:hypothetical protein n=1 Tax=Mycobacterium sp. WMMD1722 TaxID=3404117 RepID=UPI003BF55C19